MQEVLIEHGTTPTGVGVMLEMDGAGTSTVRFTSPCCGSKLDAGDASIDWDWICFSCAKRVQDTITLTNYETAEIEHWDDDYRIEIYKNFEHLQVLVRQWTGLGSAVVEVSFDE